MNLGSPSQLAIQQSFLVVVDVQGKLARLMHESDAMIHNQRILVEGCRLLDVPVIWAEQLPEKLGPTVPELAEKLEGFAPYHKSSFGCMGDPELRRKIEDLDRTQAILCGIETHVCVWQTAARMLETGYQVHLACDATSSRSRFNRDIAFQRMASEGVRLSVVEMILFELMDHAEHPRFRDVSRLLKEAG